MLHCSSLRGAWRWVTIDLPLPGSRYIPLALPAMLTTQGTFVQLNPSQDEARAALYNKGCCHAQMEQWQEAAEAVQQACNNYGLRLAVAIEASRETH